MRIRNGWTRNSVEELLPELGHLPSLDELTS